MVRTCIHGVACPLFLFVSLAVAPVIADDKKPTRLDRFGDPLPEGAIARLGTVRWRHDADVTFVTFADGGKQLLTSCGDGVIRVWDAHSGKPLREFGKKVTPYGRKGSSIPKAEDDESRWMGPPRLAASDDGKLLAIAGGDDKVHLWDTMAGKELRSFEVGHEYLFTDLGFTRDGKRLVTRGDEPKVKVWDVNTGELSFEFTSEALREDRASGGSDATHYFAVAPLVVSPDGMFAANSCMDRSEEKKDKPTMQLVVWDLKAGKELRKIKFKVADRYRMTAAPVFSPDGKYLAWARPGSTLQLYEVATGKEVWNSTEDSKGPKVKQQQQRRLIFSPDGKMLAALNIDETIQLYDVGSGKEPSEVGMAVPPQGEGYGDEFRCYLSGKPLVWTPDSKYIAQPRGKFALLWNVETGKGNDISGGHIGEITGLAASADGKTALSLGQDETIREWDVGSERELLNVQVQGATQGCLLRGPLRALAAKPHGPIYLWDPCAGKDLVTLGVSGQGERRVCTNQIRSLCAAANGGTLALDDVTQIRAFNLGEGHDLLPVMAQGLSLRGSNTVDGICALACSPDGKTLAARIDSWQRASGAGSREPKGLLRFYDLQAGTLLFEADATAPACRALVYAPSGRSLAITTGAGDTMVLLEAATGRERLRIDVPCLALAISQDSRFVALGSADGAVKLVDLHSGKEIAIFHGHVGQVSSLAFSGDGGILFSGDGGGIVLVWNMAELLCKAGKPTEADAEALKQSWESLADTDGVKAYRVVCALVASPKQAVNILKERLEPARAVEEAQIGKLIAQLDSEDFETRHKAARELGRAGERARDALKDVLQNKPSSELTKQAKQVLAWLEPGNPTPEVLREIRAVEVLETIGTPEARAVLEPLAKGAHGARLTREAATALKRLAQSK